MSQIVDFYRDECSWNPDAPKAHPLGYTLFDIVHNWSDREWENDHDFIQWLFPLKEPSEFSDLAPILTDEDIAFFQADSKLRDVVFESYLRFLKFLGMTCKFDEAQQKWVTKRLVANQVGIGEEFFTQSYVDSKMEVWKIPNHNWLRISRCLRSLRLLGLEYASASLFDELSNIFNENMGVTHNTFDFWIEAQRGDL